MSLFDVNADVRLICPKIIQLNQTIIATANFVSDDVTLPKLSDNDILDNAHQAVLQSAPQLTKQAKKHLQKQAVRLLLSQILLSDQQWTQYQFYQEHFPYRLIGTHQSYWVSFSHSQTTVGLMITDGQCGMDIELSCVSEKVARRFFHQHEWRLIQTLQDENAKQFIYNKLWQLKESLIKCHNGQLFFGMQKDCTSVIGLLLECYEFFCKHSYQMPYQKDWQAYHLTIGEHWVAVRYHG